MQSVSYLSCYNWYMRPYVHLNAAIQEEALWFLRWGGTLVYVA